MKKERLDIILTGLGLAESRSQAQKLIMAGLVRVDGQVVFKPATKFPAEVEVTLDRGPRYVSRGGEKLEAALAAFGLADLRGKACADIGASTGGFSDCLLQHGAGKVYAVDVGYGELHWKLRNDPRVVVMERTNARFLQSFPEQIELITIDASFISLKLLLPLVEGWLNGKAGEVVALIKPQFEAGRAEVSRGDGVIQDPLIHRRVLGEILEFAAGSGYEVRGLIRSPLKGPKGNAEFLAHLVFPGETTLSIPALVSGAVDPPPQESSQDSSTVNSF